MDTRAAFTLLGLSATAAPAGVKDAYRDLVKVWHPDRFTGDARLQAKATERMRELNEAYGIALAHASAYNGVRGSRAPEPESADRPGAGGAPAPAAAPAASAPPHRRTVWPQPYLAWDMIWRALFFAVTFGVIAFIVTAPEGFFALSKGRSAGRPPRGHAPGPQVFDKLPESEHGEADLVSRVRGTWVVVETGDAEWLPSGTHVDLSSGVLACSGPRPCQADRRGALQDSRRHGRGRARRRGVVRLADDDAVGDQPGRRDLGTDTTHRPRIAGRRRQLAHAKISP